MKRILTLMIIAMMACATYAQKDVTKFLGIPVDGTKTAMKQKLGVLCGDPSIECYRILREDLLDEKEKHFE